MYGIFTCIYPQKLPKCRDINRPYIEHLGKWPTNKPFKTSVFLHVFNSPSPKWGRPRHLKECHHGLQWLHARTRWLWWEGPEWVSGGERETEKKQTLNIYIYNYIYTLPETSSKRPLQIDGWFRWFISYCFFLRPIFSGAFSLLWVSVRVNHRGGWVTLKN